MVTGHGGRPRVELCRGFPLSLLATPWVLHGHQCGKVVCETLRTVFCYTMLVAKAFPRRVLDTSRLFCQRVRAQRASVIRRSTAQGDGAEPDLLLTEWLTKQLL